jgi:hypothetical protein
MRQLRDSRNRQHPGSSIVGVTLVVALRRGGRTAAVALLSRPCTFLLSFASRVFPGRIFPKIGNAFPTAWEISRGIVFADIVFARPRSPPAGVSELALADLLVTWFQIT